MARPIDYSKWKDIEISDDEDDTHPNIDTPSLFKWRHEARIQREKEFEEKKKNAENERKKIEAKLREIKEKTEKQSAEDLSDLKKSLKDVEEQANQAKKKLEEVEHEEKLKPWNIDTISKEGFSKTLINKPASRKNDNLTDEQREDKMKKFVTAHEKELKEYGMLQRFDDSKRFLQERNYLACEETANYLVIWCINLAMEEKFELMNHVAHQTIAMQYLLELSRQLDTDPRACISSFFTKIQVADQEYKNAFYEELAAFKERVRRRAKEKIEEQMAEMEEEERSKRIEASPGGLDPVEVFDSLPVEMQQCFEAQDIGKLQEVIRELPEAEAREHMRRCIASGLWVPSKDDPNTNPDDGFVRRGDGPGEEGEEPVYEDPKEAAAK